MKYYFEDWTEKGHTIFEMGSNTQHFIQSALRNCGVYVANCIPYKNGICKISNVDVLFNFDDVKLYLRNYGELYNDNTIDKQIEEINDKYAFVVTVRNNNIEKWGDAWDGINITITYERILHKNTNE